MGTLVQETDIDQFIRANKARLQQDRSQLNQYTDQSRYPRGQAVNSPSSRKQWDREQGRGTRPAEELRGPPEPEETGLQLSNGDQQEKKKHQLQSERQQEYNDMLAKRQQMLQDEYRREFAEEQRLAVEKDGLPLGDSNRHKLDNERKLEYNEYLAKKGQRGGARRADMLEGTGATLPVGEYDDSRRQQLMSERQKEYNEQQQQKLATGRQRGLPPKPPTPNHFFKNIGEHDRQQQMLNDERKKEYKQKLSEESGRTGRRLPDGSGQNATGLAFKNTDSAEVRLDKKEYATLPGLHYSQSPEVRKMKARNEEYNEFLQDKLQKDAHRFDNKKPPTAASRRHSEPSSPQMSPRGKKKEFGTLPGLHYSDSADKRKMQERNKEYNEFLRQKQGKKGWATPTYEEILDQKRREEAYRRQDDDDPGMRRYGSEGAINRLQNDYRESDLDLEARKVRFDNDAHQGILQDDNWLNPEMRREHDYNQVAVRSERQDDMAARVRHNPGYLASLPVGEEERNSAKIRRQSDYRNQLQLQMEERKAARIREKLHELPVNASGLLDPEKSSNRIRGLEGQPVLSPRREYKSKDVQPYHTKFLLENSGDEFQYDTGGHGRERGRRRDRDSGLLDNGFAGLLDSRRPIGTVNPPPGIMYQPSTYVTGGGSGPGDNSIDQAYLLLGMTNPLDPESRGGGGGGGVPALNFGGDYGGGQMRGSPTPRVTFADGPPSTRRRDRSQERISPYQFRSDDDVRSKSRSETQNYGAELEIQIQEKRRQKMKEKQDQERYEKKLEADIQNYNPFGRGGGGAPVRDEHGNAIADLRTLQRGGADSYQSPRRDQSPTHIAPRDDKIGPPPAQHTASGDTTYARGGHGIFGMPKTDAEKDQSEKYKDDLREQIALKRQQELKNKEEERREEERENKKLEDERLRMQSEYEEEQKKGRMREEDTRRKNEELKKQAEDRKKEDNRKKREADDERMRDQQDQLEREKRDREQRETAANERLKSPPVPAMKVKTPEERDKSPPVPTQRRGRDSAASNKSRTSQRSQHSQRPGLSSDRPGSSDVLTQLATMRQQLQSERRRVENALEQNRNEPEVFDARTIQRVPPNKLIFENAMNRNASLPPPRAPPPESVNAGNIQSFNELKFKADTESRRGFRRRYPEAPLSNTTLETQQDAMLRQQEDQLRSLRDRNKYDPTPSGLSYGRGHGNVSARSQLASNSAFIDVEGIHHFPEDFDDMAGARNESARTRRRERYSPRAVSNNGMGSQMSLDVENIQRKNEERLRKLNHMSTAGDDISTQDPDDILERFMAKQRHNRPPTRQTLQEDDTWLLPGHNPI